MVGDTIVTGSDDWTARMWSVSRGTCDAVLACHAGPILCVEYSVLDKGIITGFTFFFSYFSLFFLRSCRNLLISYVRKSYDILSGSTDGLLRFWENEEGMSIIDFLTSQVSLFFELYILFPYGFI